MIRFVKVLVAASPWILAVSAALAQPTLSNLQPADGTVLVAGQGTLTGTAAGAVTLSIGGSDVALGSGGAFSWEFSLPEGPSTLQLYAEDASGLSTSRVHQLVVDTRDPQVSVTQPSSSVVGAQPVQISGTYFEPHLSSLTVAGLAATASGGTWQVSVPLVEGVQALTVAAVDSLGHGTSFPITLTLDTTDPSVSVTESGSPFGGGLYNRAVTPVIAASDATALTVEIVLDGSPFVSGTTVAEEGSHHLDATATDAAGNTTTVRVDFAIDTTSPTVGVVQPMSGGVVGSASVTMQVEAPGATRVRVTGPGGAVEANGSGLFSVGPVVLVEGTSDLVVEAFDDAGNRTSRSHRLIRDTTPPILTVTAPSSGDVVSSATVAAQGTAQDPRLQSVTVEGILANLVGEGWSVADVPLAEGVNVLQVIATDSVGNQTTHSVTVQRDTAAPTFQVLVDGVELISGATFSGPVAPVIEVDTVQFPGAVVNATLDGLAFTSGTLVSTDGSHELSVTVTSGAGVPSSRLLIFVIDQQAPTISEILPADGHLQREPEVSLSGTVSGAQVVTVDGQPATLYQGSFSAGPFALAEGVRTFTVVATGANGLAATRQHTIERDATPPTVSFSSPAADALLGDPAISVSGLAQDPNLLSVSVNETPAVISASTWHAAGVPLREGSTTLTARAEDRAGNVAEATRSVVLDTTAPEIAITDPAPGTLLPDATYEVRGTLTEEHIDRVDVAVTATSTGDTSSVRATVSGTSWHVEVPLAAGINQITATARDLLGATATDTASIERDADAPQVRIVVPGDGAYVNTATVEVRGTVTDEPGTTVKVNGLGGLIDQGAWTVSNVALSQGENRLLARAADAQGNEGVHTRTVYLDQDAPTYLSSDPSSGALALPVDAVFRLEFSEPLQEPDEGSWALATSSGTSLPAGASLVGNELVITPDGPLPSQTQVVLTLTSELRDRAGNALANPPSPLVYATVDIGAPDAPVLTFEPSRFLCAPEVVLSGTAEPATRVEVRGGASSNWIRAADGTGQFLLTVELLSDRLNRLEVTATDTEGNQSTATVVEVVQDCTAPQVASSQLFGQQLTVAFTEAIDAGTVAGNVTVRDAAGALAFTTSAETDTVTLTLAEAPAGSVLLDLATGIRDLAANALAYPYHRLFGDASGAESFVSGTVIDDATGRPLVGATVQITATDGQQLGEPLPQQTTSADGRFLIPVAAGTHDLTAARPGYAPVFRIVTTQAGEGTNVFDPRLTPMSPAVTIGTGGGTVVSSGAAQLTLPGGALAQSTPVTLTELSEQALPALLPYGWSPRGAAWIESDQTLQSGGILTLPVTSPNGTLLDLVSLDLATLQWQVVGQTTVSDGSVTVTVPTLGAYAAVQADTGTLAPPAAQIGEILGSSPSPAGDEVESATLTFDPEVVLPTQRARATATYTLKPDAADTPSGLPLTLIIEEELELLDGTILREAPYQADLVLYRDDVGTPTSSFWLRPSDAARTAPLRLGGEDVTILPYGDETVRGNVLGPEGGSVVDAEGDRLDVPAGALAVPAAIVLTRQTEADLPLAAPRGATIDAVLDLDLGGARFEIAADLSIAMATPPAEGTKGLLLQVLEIDELPTYRVLAELTPTATGWETAPIDSADLAWPGIATGGQLVAVRLTEPHGFVRGRVVSSTGQYALGAVVSAETVDWIQLTDNEGRYVLPLPLGDHVVTARSPQTGNAVQVAITVTADGERVDLDPTLQVVAPWITEVTPGDGAVGIPVGVEPTVRFSEPVDRAGLAAGLQLLQDGQAVAVDFDHQGDFVRLLPQATLVPGTLYELRIGGEIRDLDGYGLNGPLTTTFRTEDDPSTSGRLDRSKVVTLAPDSQGLVQVIGHAGAVPGNSLVYVENLTSYSTTESVTSDQDGSFQLSIGAGLDDRLLLHVLIEGSSEDLMSLGPFLSADQKSAYVQVGGADWTTIEGMGVEVFPETFGRSTWVRAEMRASGPIPTPEGFHRLANLQLDFGGAEARKGLLLTIPAADADPSNEYLLSRYVDALGFRTWMVMDLMRIDGGHLTNARVGESKAARLGDKSVGLQSSAYGVPDRHRILTASEARRLRAEPGLVLFDAVDRTRAVHSKSFVEPLSVRDKDDGDEEPPTDPFQAQVRLIQSGQYEMSFTGKDEISWLALQAQVTLYTMAIGGFGAVLTISPALVAEMGLRWLLIPTLLNQPYELEVRDLTTGYQVYREVQPPPMLPLTILPPDIYGDDVPPFPVLGNPIRIHSFLIHEDMAILSLPRNTTVEFTGTKLTVKGTAGAVDPKVEVGLQQVVEGTGTPKKKFIPSSNPDGSFVLELDAVKPGEHYLFVAGALVGGADRVEITFSEALPDPPLGIELVVLRDQAQLPVEERIRLLDGGQLLQINPRSGWRKGKYGLRLGPELQDVGGTQWKQDLLIKLEVPESSDLGTLDVAAPISDMARMGNLLLAAANSDGLRIYDMTHPKFPQHYLKQDRGLVLPMSNLVRGVDVDSHGRIFIVGGGQSSFGQMKLIDLTKIDPAMIQPEPSESFDVEVAKGFRGSTLISDPISGDINTPLRAGLPRHVAVANNDLVDPWMILEESPPEGVTLSFTESGESGGAAALDRLDQETEVKVSGTGEEPNVPITLRNATRGRWSRVEADEDGAWEIRMKVGRYDEMVLQRSRGAFAYVTVEGVGLAVVDILDFFDEEITEATTASNLLSYIEAVDLTAEPDEAPCDQYRISFSTLPTDIDLIVEPEPSQTLSLFSLIQGYGFAIQTAPFSEPTHLEQLADFCGAVDDQATLTAMDVVQGYGIDLDGDGEVLETDHIDPLTGKVDREKEVRDYVLLGHGSGYVLIVDVTKRTEPKLKAQIRLGKEGDTSVHVAALTFDKPSKRIFVSAFGTGIISVDFSTLPSGDNPRQVVDEDQDGTDDRVLETIEVNSDVRDVFLLPEFGIALAGSRTGTEGRLTSLLVGAPEISFLAVDKEPLRKVDRIAPFGVPTAPQDPNDPESPDLPGLVRVQAVFPGLASTEEDLAQPDLSTLDLDLLSVGPELGEIDGVGDDDGMPATGFTDDDPDDDPLVLRRMAENPWEPGYAIYLSDPIVVLSDLTAAAEYELSDDEKEVCRRCDLKEEDVYPKGVPEDETKRLRELLSGHYLLARPAGDLADAMPEFYENSPYGRAQGLVESVPWDITPSLQQEPVLSASFSQQGLLGTLLHSGEQTWSATDLVLPAVNFDLAFTRNYRSQTVGSGPLGPGWDHGYRVRLRVLPNEDVELFDGTGRRELFEWKDEKFQTPPGRFAGLVGTSTGFTLADNQGVVSRFDRYGRLQNVSSPTRKDDKSGSKLVFDYDDRSRLSEVRVEVPKSPTDSPAQEAPAFYLAISYDEEGRIESVTDSVSSEDQGPREYAYEYDAEGRLEFVNSPEVQLKKGGPSVVLTTQYAYDPTTPAEFDKQLHVRDNLASITDAKGDEWIRFKFAASEDGRFTELEEQTLESRSDFGTRSSAWKLSFTSRNPSQVTVLDPLQNSWIYHHTPQGHPTEMRDPLGSKWSWEYGAYPEIEHGLLTRTKSPEGLVSEIEYIEAANLAAGAPPSTGSTVRLAHVASKTTTFEEGGFEPPPPVEATDEACEVPQDGANGSAKELVVSFNSHHARISLPGRVTLPSGLEVHLDFDDDTALVDSRSIYKVSGATEEPASVLRSTYDYRGVPIGNAIEYSAAITGVPGVSVSTSQSQQSATSEVKYKYGTDFPEVVTHDFDGLQVETSIENNDLGQATETTEPESAGSESEFNILGWPLRICRKSGFGPVCRELVYDQNGRVVEQKLPYGEMGGGSSSSIRTSYGSLGEMLRTETVVEPTGQTLVETREYDQNLNLTKIDGPSSLPIEIGYDARNLPVTKRVNGGDWGEAIQSSTYDSDGRLLTTTDSQSNVWSTAYDGFGRPMLEVDPLGEFVLMTYDNNQRPIEVKECKSGGELVSQWTAKYDNRGLMTERTVATEIASGQVIGSVTEFYAYDGLGQPLFQLDGSGAGTVITRDGAGRVEEVEIGRFDLAGGFGAESKASFRYDSRGNLQSETHHVLDTHGIVGAPTEFRTLRGYDRLDRMVYESNTDSGTLTFEYDQQDNVIRTIRQDNSVVSATYDSAGRPLNLTRPGGLSVDYVYTDEADSRMVRMTDARQNATTWSYDGQGLLTSLVYPDSTSDSYEYDSLGRPILHTRRDGTALEQTFDALSRLRSIAIGPNVVESFAYETPGAGRRLVASRGATLTTFAYDARSLPTLVASDVGSMATNTFDISTAYTGSGLPAASLYPSSLSLYRTFDASGQASSIQTESGALADYERLTPFVLGRVSRTDAPNLSWTVDLAGRAESYSVGEPSQELYKETLQRSARGFLSKRNIEESSGTSSISWIYDGAGRLTNESESYPSALLESFLGAGEGFIFDSAENLVLRNYHSACGDVSTSFGVQPGNQLTVGGGPALSWDDNGNLKQKGDMSFSYDHRDRLVNVSDLSGIVAEYSYDALDRRVLRKTDGKTFATVWDGWRPIEDYELSGGTWILTHRQVHGEGLDDILHLEIRDGPEMVHFTPVFDTSGSVVLLLDSNNQPVERYFYSPFGERWVWSRGALPAVEQVRVEEGVVYIELSEQVRDGALTTAINAGAIRLDGLDPEVTTQITVDAADGRSAGRRLKLQLSGEPEKLPKPGDELTLLVSATALEDLFDGATAAQDLVSVFTWAVDQVVLDTSPPELEEACLTQAGKVRLVFSEPLKSSASGLISIDGQSQSWTTSSDGYSLTSSATYQTGSHVLSLLAGEYDLAGQSPAELANISFTGSNQPTLLALAPESSISRNSHVDNHYGFQGLRHDAETGLVFARHRYLDPELGRFTTTDPLGYVDGPNLYQFAGSNPVNFHDPLGLSCPDCREPARRRERARLAAERRQRVDEGAFDLIGRSENIDSDQLRNSLGAYFRSQGYDQYEAASSTRLYLGSRGNSSPVADAIPSTGMGSWGSYWEDVLTHYPEAIGFGELGFAGGQFLSLARQVGFKGALRRIGLGSPSAAQSAWASDLDQINATVGRLGRRALRESAGGWQRSEYLFERYLEVVQSRLSRTYSRYGVELQPATHAAVGRVPPFVYIHHGGASSPLITNRAGQPILFAFPGSQRMDAAIVDIRYAEPYGYHRAVSGFDITLDLSKRAAEPYYRKVFGDIPVFDIRPRN